MNWRSFHHPDWCLPVARRRVAAEMLEMLELTAKILMTRGRYLAWGHSYPNRSAYFMAMHRLRKQGLIAYRRQGGREPALYLTAKGEAQLPDVGRPQRFWDRPWRGIWYVLVYDVPESNRSYRNALRGFLRQMRMGYLQGSVWVSARDIRAEFSDLAEAAAAGDYAFLFEARTVLGLRPEVVVRSAWEMEALRKSQQWFCGVCEENLRQLAAGRHSSAALASLSREAMAGYEVVMDKDPLLPRALWPSGYAGEEAYRLHRALQVEVAKRL
jgi:phenylacetic acid degradation operon negative regulatory protein